MKENSFLGYLAYIASAPETISIIVLRDILMVPMAELDELMKACEKQRFVDVSPERGRLSITSLLQKTIRDGHTPEERKNYAGTVMYSLLHHLKMGAESMGNTSEFSVYAKEYLPHLQAIQKQFQNSKWQEINPIAREKMEDIFNSTKGDINRILFEAPRTRYFGFS